MKTNDFSKGPVWRCIVSQSVPLIIAQLVHLLYNVVDRIYIGHMEGDGAIALTGVGITFPIITVMMAFSALFGMGGVPLFAIERGAKNNERAARIMGNSFALLLASSAVLTVLGYSLTKPLLFALGASEVSYVYASQYLTIYLSGTVFSIIATGMNGYINAEGYPKIGMISIILGAAANIILDPFFIFVLGMGVKGAALATVISQALSAIWVVAFLSGKKAEVKLAKKYIRFEKSISFGIVKLGTASFIMQGTTCAVQIVCNSTLQKFGGDLFVGIMTVTNSVRDIFMLPVSGITSGAQPVISYNYGAKRYDRVRSGIIFNTAIGAAYTAIAWIAVLVFPKFWFGIFASDPSLIDSGSAMLKIYFNGFVFMALQFAGQSAFQSLGDARHAITFSLLRKVVIDIPLTLILPYAGLCEKGVFIAEPISNVIGGVACYTTMILTVYRKLGKSVRNSKDEKQIYEK